MRAYQLSVIEVRRMASESLAEKHTGDVGSGMMEAAVVYKRDSTGAQIILNRPSMGNALNSEMVDALDEAIEFALQDQVPLIVFRGSGKHFCTGFDLNDLDSCSDGDLLLRFVRIEQVLQKIYRCPVVTVAIAGGKVYGAGADVFVSCDRRVCDDGASFAFPGSGFGLILGTRRLSTRIGSGATRRLLLAGKPMSASDAMEIGLATDLCDSDKLPNLLERAYSDATRLNRATVAGLHRATCSADDHADMAALVRSASVSGLGERIRTYRQAAMKRT